MIKSIAAVVSFLIAMAIILSTNHPGWGFVFIIISLGFIASVLRDDPVAAAVDRAIDGQISSRELFRTHG